MIKILSKHPTQKYYLSTEIIKLNLHVYKLLYKAFFKHYFALFYTFHSKMLLEELNLGESQGVTRR